MRGALRGSLTLTSSPTRVALFVVVLAFALRLVVRLIDGPGGLEDGGYGFYRRIAENLVQGHGSCLGPDVGCALRPPLYPLLLVPFLFAGGLFPGLVVVQAVAGALLTWLAFVIGRRLFDAPSGIGAALLAAVSPYAVIHDTALQETVVVNLLIAVAACLLVIGADRRSEKALIFAGVVVGAAILTTARVALTAPVIATWLLVAGQGRYRARLLSCACFVLPVVLLVGGWMVRNWRVVGAPVLTTESGASLWVAHNAETFNYFPAQSVDLIPGPASALLTAAQNREYEELSSDPVAQDAVAREWAVDYIAAHPGEVVVGAARKVWVVISAELSPTRSAASSLGYRVFYGAVHLLAIVGLWRSRHAWRRHGAIYAVLAAFGLTTAIFWAHTSHKSLIDVFLFVYAASVVSRGIARRMGFGEAWSARPEAAIARS